MIFNTSRTSPCLAATSLIILAGIAINAQEPVAVNPFLHLMTQAAAHATAHNALRPALSPNDATVLSGQVPVSELQRQGIQVIPWTTNDPEQMRAILRVAPNGLISDRPDLLQKVLAEERTTNPSTLKTFNVQGHRGARGLRPENTLPAFEAGLDNLISTIETDTGVTTDHHSLIWHDQFLNPQSCRKADGSPYTIENRVYIRDISLVDAQKTFICDKLHTAAFPDQRNDLALSPVAVAFAQHEHLMSPYVPTHAEQLFRFTAFYTDYYRTGPGKSHPEAQARATAAAKVHFNLETKILPDDLPSPATGTPEAKIPRTCSRTTPSPPRSSSTPSAEPSTATTWNPAPTSRASTSAPSSSSKSSTPPSRPSTSPNPPTTLATTLVPIPLRQP